MRFREAKSLENRINKMKNTTTNLKKTTSTTLLVLIACCVAALSIWAAPATVYANCVHDYKCDQSSVEQYRWSQPKFWTGVK